MVTYFDLFKSEYNAFESKEEPCLLVILIVKCHKGKRGLGVKGSILSAFTHGDSESVRIQSDPQFLFTLLGYTCAKAARKTLMKLTQGKGPKSFEVFQGVFVLSEEGISSTTFFMACMGNFSANLTHLKGIGYARTWVSETNLF